MTAIEALALAPGLFPAGVVARAIRLHPQVNVALAHLRTLDAARLPESLECAIPKRQLDFAAGRYCAREALRGCAPDLSALPIAIGANREPVWPRGITGSIAHTRGVAIAAVARVDVVRGIGVDVEHWLDEGAPGRLGSELAVDGELEAIVQATGWPPAKALTLVFSAKEALYKCLYPEGQQYFGFRDARIAIADAASGEMRAVLLRGVGALPSGLEVDGRFSDVDEILGTALTLPSR